MKGPHPTPSNLAGRLTAGEQSFRRVLLELIIRLKRPVTGKDLAEAAGVSLAESDTRIAAIFAKGLLAKTAGGEIAFVYPVSALPTRHRVSLADGRDLYAMCAIDALGCTFEFGQDAKVISSCSQCQQPISVALKGVQLRRAEPATIKVMHIDLGQYADWAASC